MSTTQQPEALRLAAVLENYYLGIGCIDAESATAELRRLHDENTTLQQGYAAARLEITSLQAKNTELERLCDATYVASGADAYHHACEQMERRQQERAAAGKVVGTEGSLCDGLAWLYGYLAGLESQLETARLEIESLLARGVVPDVSGYVSEWAGGLCTSDEAMDGIAKLYAAQPAGAQQPGTAYAALFDALSQHDDPCDDFAEAVQRVRALRAEVERLTRADSARVDALALRESRGQAPAQAAPAAVAGPSDDRVRECAARLVEHADFQLGGTLSADSKARDIPSRACSQVKARHLAALRDALAAAPTTQPAPQQEAQERVFLVATGETLNGRELYERHEKYVPLADCETLYTAPQPSPASQGDGLDAVPTQAAPCDTPNYCRSVQRCTALDEARATKDRGQYD